MVCKTFLILFLFWSAGSAVQDVTQQTLGDSNALAALEQPGQVFFSEDFEDGDYNGWFDAYGPPTVVNDPVQAHSGSHVLKCVAAYKNDNASTSSIKYWFHPGYDKAHFRWYVRFAADFDQGWGMHFCSMYAVQGDNRYNEMGGAGTKPDGDDRYGTGFEPWSSWETLTPPGRMQFYAYWHQMAPDIYDDNNDDIPDTHYWGNVFFPDPPVIPERDKWICMEMMIKANDAGSNNGEMAAWIDGKLYLHLNEFNFRTVDALKLKRISLGIYIHNNPKENTAWFDDVALSTGYIGPVSAPAINSHAPPGLKGAPFILLGASGRVVLMLDRPGYFNLNLFDLSGRKIWNYHRSYANAGHYNFNLNSRITTSGIYIFQMECETGKYSGKLLIIN
jgi:hypothetical protein